MDFFEHQERARGRSRWLVLYFALAVILIVLSVNLAVYAVLRMTNLFPHPLAFWWQQPWWVLITLGISAIMLGTSLFRIGQLAKGGGAAVAQMVGATPVDLGAQEPELRRLINVVEEMSLASGVRQPQLYVWEGESGINAFVAGFDPSQTALVVTRGALDNLTRDQLQGVIGHEYSHVFNGDVRINTRLIGVLAGILLIGQSGLFVLRSLRFTGRSRGRSGGQAILAVVAIGGALTVIGFIGLFFGRMIQSAVSRQREFLADAASVQYTRNPPGLAGALAAIDQHYWGARISAKHAEDMAHICFGETRRSSLLASHPPIADRIQRIAPGFQLDESQRKKIDAKKAPKADRTPRSKPRAAYGVATPETILYASTILAAIARPIQSGLRNPRAAKGVLYALLLAESQEGRDEGLTLLQQQEGHDLKNLAANLIPIWQQQDSKLRLPVVDLALPHLKRLPQKEIDLFLKRVDALVKLDRKLSLFEYLLRVLLHAQLKEAHRVRKPGTKKLTDVYEEVVLLLSVLSHAGHKDEKEGEAAYQAAVVQLLSDPPARLAEEACKPSQLHTGLTQLMGLAPLEKKALLEAIMDCILHDEETSAEEAEILRVVCEVLDVPLPAAAMNPDGSEGETA